MITTADGDMLSIGNAVQNTIMLYDIEYCIFV
jgi:hypothetical protein